MGSKDADLAVVVVHGIGSQTAGATLLAWAEPIIKELSRTVSSHTPGGITFGATELETDPATTTISFVDMDQPELRRTWKFIEARWASSFPVPTVSEVLHWAPNFIPRAATRIWRQLTRPVGAYRGALDTVAADSELNPRAKRRLLMARIVFALYSSVWFLVTTVAILLTATAAAVFAVVLTVLGTLPVIRKRFAPVTAQLVASVGDAYLFTARPLHTAAMIDTISQAVVQAHASADKVCVIAHSQGAALAIRTLTTRVPAEKMPHLLFTVGAGVNLLGGGTAPVAGWLERAPGMEWVNIWTPWDPVPSGPIADNRADEASRAREATSADHVSRLFATGDPGGPSLSSAAAGSSAGGEMACGPEEWPVYNLASVTRDHVTYTGNVPQVIRPVTERLLALTTGTAPALPALDEAHIRRVRYLGTARLVAGLAASVYLALRYVYWETGGSNSDKLRAFLDSSLKGFYDTPIVGPTTASFVANDASVLYEMALGLSMFTMMYLAFRFVWGWWNRQASTLSVAESNQTEYPFSVSRVCTVGDWSTGRHSGWPRRCCCVGPDRLTGLVTVS